LEVDSDGAAVDVSTLTEDTNIMNSYLNDSLTTHSQIADEEDYSNLEKSATDNNKIEDDGGATIKGGVKSKWLANVLKRRKAKQDRYKQLQALCRIASESKALGTVDESFSASTTTTNTTSSSSGDDDEDGDPNNDTPSGGGDDEASPKRSKKGKISLTLNLDEYDDAQFENVVQNLTGRNDLTKLELYRNAPGKGESYIRSTSSLGNFFSEVCGLTQLQELVLWNFNPDCSWLLTCFLKERPPVLRSFRLHHARGSVSNDLLKALVQVPTITDIVLEMQHDFPLDILFSSSSLRSLKINGHYNIGRKNFSRAMKILGRNNRSLQTLDIKPLIATASMRDLSAAVEQNKTLQKMCFSFQTESVDASGEALIDLSKALTQNQSLKELVNRNYQSVQVSSDNKIFAEAFLESNKILERFQFYNERACVDRRDDDSSSPISTTSDAAKISTETILSWFVACGVIDLLCKR
jgi:hypothetical protein